MIPQDKLSELYGIYAASQRITTDSRSIPAGSIFFALKGAYFDGNRFAADALSKGAALAVVDDSSVLPVAECGEVSHTESVGKGYFLVEDVLTALQELAAMHRTALGIPILAITGTNGKTTTKELTAAVLSKKFKLSATHGNLNNHIGVPLTLLSMGSDVEFGIVEMGANAQKEIDLLCRIAKPDYGIITNVGRAHLEGFGGEEGVKITKGELYDWLASSDGYAFVRKDDDKLNAMAAQRETLNTLLYSSSLGDGYESRLAGDYNRLNIAAAVAIGEYFKVVPDDIRSAIREYNPTLNRSQVIKTKCNTVIADCYNANPSSMRVALQWFGKADMDERRGKTIIIGDMFELGAWSAEEHNAVLNEALSVAPDNLILVGGEFAQAIKKLPGNVAHGINVCVFENTDAVMREIKDGNTIIEEHLILLKGSHGMALERLLDLL